MSVGPAASDIAVDALLTAVAPLERTFRPTYRGFDSLTSDRPLLFVGNHVIWSGIDILLLAAGLAKQADVRLRPLGDRAHFQVPIWRTLLRAYGAVEGTRPNCAELMRRGECILVYPGGAREVSKRRGEKYQLLWGNRVGFAKMALEHGATIIPAATVGGEEMWDILVDANDVLASPLGPILRKLEVREDMIAPLVTGLGPLPKPVRMYFELGAPIRPSDVPGGDLEVRAKSLKELTKASLERSLASLMALRAEDERAESRSPVSPRGSRSRR